MQLLFLTILSCFSPPSGESFSEVKILEHRRIFYLQTNVAAPAGFVPNRLVAPGEMAPLDPLSQVFYGAFRVFYGAARLFLGCL